MYGADGIVIHALTFLLLFLSICTCLCWSSYTQACTLTQGTEYGRQKGPVGGLTRVVLLQL